VATTAILAVGHSLPSRLVTNEALADRLHLDARALTRDTGVGQRYYADVGRGPSDLALEASTMALNRAGLGGGDLDFLLFATMTPDIAFPGPGCLLQDKLGVPPIGALDIRAQCVGFVFGLMVADRFLQAGTYQRVLVAAAEVHSTSLDFSPRGAGVTPYFGDGGAAAVLATAEDGRGIVAGVMHTDATRYEQFWCEYPKGSQYPVRMTVEDLRRGLHYPRMDLEALNPVARSLLSEAVGEVVEKGGCDRREIAHYFFDYVHPPTAMAAAEAMRIPPDRITAASVRAGHIGAASLPIALSQAWSAGAVRRGDLVCLAAVGAGINWGAVLLRL
jgi:3-oxoacyl-[acyl-carrier-protein] synthase-3